MMRFSLCITALHIEEGDIFHRPIEGYISRDFDVI